MSYRFKNQKIQISSGFASEIFHKLHTLIDISLKKDNNYYMTPCTCSS